MAKVSVIIPARNEHFLPHTVKDLLTKAAGDVEVIVILEGYWPDPLPMEDPRLVLIHRPTPRGMRAAINTGANVARGDYLMKCDAHCLFAEGYDEALKADCDRDWVAIPRRYSLDEDNWKIRDDKGPVDYHYLSCPITNNDGYSMHGQVWYERHRKPWRDILIDDTMSFQGSCWFMHRSHFFDRLHGMSETGYGGFCQEPQEIGNKTWLMGGRLVVNKKTHYAHLHKGKKWGRGYFQSKREIISGHTWAGHHWMNDEEPGMVHKFEWLVDKFWPVPTWPENWRELVGRNLPAERGAA